MSPASVDDWEENLLEGRYLPAGNEVTVTIGDGRRTCTYDPKTVFEDGRTAQNDGVDLCTDRQVHRARVTGCRGGRPRRPGPDVTGGSRGAQPGRSNSAARPQAEVSMRSPSVADALDQQQPLPEPVRMAAAQILHVGLAAGEAVGPCASAMQVLSSAGWFGSVSAVPSR